MVGNHQAGASGISQVDGDLELVPTCAYHFVREGFNKAVIYLLAFLTLPTSCAGRSLNEGTMTPPSISVLKIAAPPALTMKPENSLTSCMSLVVFELLFLPLLECRKSVGE